MNFSPPYPTRLKDLAVEGRLNKPANAQIHVGSEDWQASPVAVQELASLLDIPVNVVPKEGHMLGHGYVNKVLDRWLP